MNISFKWLQEFVDFTERDPQKIAETLTLNTAEIEYVRPYFFQLDKMVVGKIVKLRSHPNADKLKICMVDNGKQVVQIVCGGSNLYENMLVALAQPGSEVRWHGEGDLISLTPTTIRGEASEGMICASEEIGLSAFFPKKSEKDIMDLTEYAFSPGQSLEAVLELEDSVFEIDNTAITHRPDLFSHLGFARECVANGLGSWKKLTKKSLPSKSSGKFPLDIKIAKSDLAPRYAAMVIKNVPVCESPLWMKQRLDACGIRPINSHVDITNYVMLACGVPTHSFDFKQIEGKKVIMRESAEGEEVTTLDGQHKKLPGGLIVFEDEQGIFDLCGVMGGERSGISNETDTIWFHAPVYEKKRIRRAIQVLNHRTEAATIYEKGVPTSMVPVAMELAWQLIETIYPQAELVGPILDQEKQKSAQRIIELHESQLHKIIGFEMPLKTAGSILQSLDFTVSQAKKKGVLAVEVPGHRFSDVEIQEDLIEEIVRIYGINTIEAVLPEVPMASMSLPPAKQSARVIRAVMQAHGFFEAYNYSFLGEELLQKCLMEVPENSARVKNAISEDMALMRQSLLPRLLSNVVNNLRYTDTMRLYELGRVYELQKGLPIEKTKLGGVLVTAESDLGGAKAVLDNLAWRFNLPLSYQQKTETLPSYMHAGRSAELLSGDTALGYLAELHPQVLVNLDIKRKRVIFFELCFDTLLECGSQGKTYQSLAKFPSITLDLNIIIPKYQAAEKYRVMIVECDAFLIKKVNIVDEYSGAQIPEDKRSVTFSIEYNAEDRTLTDQEVHNIHQAVVTRLTEQGALLRT